MRTSKSSMYRCGWSAAAMLALAAGAAHAQTTDCSNCTICTVSSIEMYFFVAGDNFIVCETASASVSASAIAVSEWVCPTEMPDLGQGQWNPIGSSLWVNEPFVIAADTAFASIPVLPNPDGCDGVSAGAVAAVPDVFANAAAFAEIDPSYARYDLETTIGFDCSKHPCWEARAAAATANATLNFELDDPNDTVLACVYFNCPTPTMSQQKIFLQYIDTSCGCGWLACSPFGGSLPSSSLSLGASSQYELCCTIDATNGVTFDIQTFSGSIDVLDVNGDGRFNHLDPPALEKLVLMYTVAGPSSPSVGDDISPYIGPLHDINGDGEVNLLDSDMMQAIIDCGFDTGVFGDANGDGKVKCADETAQSAFPLQLSTGGSGSTVIPVHLGDPDYMFELDHNLDGVLDASDEAAFNALFVTCP